MELFIRRRISGGLVGLLLLIGVVGCGQPGETESPAARQVATEAAVTQPSETNLHEEEPSPAFTGAAPEVSTPAPPAPAGSQDLVLAACQSGAQGSSLRSEEAPDWSALALSACYELTLRIDEGGQTYPGSARITFTNPTGIALESLVFRLYPNADRIYGGELAIDAVEVDGEPAELGNILPDRTAVQVPLAEPLLPGETAVVEMDFTGRVASGLGRGLYGIFHFDDRAQVLTLANWYPILAALEDGGWESQPVIGIGDAVVSAAALYLVQITAPPEWQVIATGSVVDEEELEGGQQFTFASGPARDFTVVAGPNFERMESEVNGVRVQHWGLSGGEARWEETLGIATRALELFEARFGPYPYAELDSVAVPLRLASGVEYPGLILISQALYQPDNERPFYLDIVVSHEVAHQWWYATVGNDVLEYPWQDEALATFSALLYLQVHQPEIYPGTLEVYASRVASAEDDLDATGVSQPVRAFVDQPAAYSPIVYQKGALFFAALRERLGDEAFFQALRSYYNQNAYEVPQPNALLDSFESACACSLDEFYREWGVE